jgi:hypothetical protein
MFKLYYYHSGSGKKHLVKKTNQKIPIKMVGSKSTYPKWHFGQVGHGGKKTILGGCFDKNSLSKKPKFLVVNFT